MLQELFQPVIAFLHHNPQSAGIIVFFIACGEAMAIIGTIIPGSITMTAVGTLIGAKIIPVGSTFLWAMGGAVTGDTISYLVGYYYKQRIRKIWPFTKYTVWFDKGEKFFHKHGGKSVIIGRFFGPFRSMVPLIAGTLNMPPGRFLLAAVPSASAWAVGYMIPGIMIGALSLELPPKLAIEFIIYVLIIIALFVLFTWLIRFFSKQLADKIDQESLMLWFYLQSRKKTHWITRILTNPRNPENHGQLILAVYLVITGLLFLLILADVLNHGLLYRLNAPIYHLLRSMRSNIGDNIFLVFTILGSKKVMLISSGLILLWFGIKRYWRTAAHFLATVVLCSGTIFICKHLLFTPRPGQLVNGPIDSSFPSGHVCLTASILGFLAVLIAQELKPGLRRIPYLIAIWLTALVGFSRLFLGAHWLTDIIGSILLAIIIILLVTIAYRRSIISLIPIKQFSLIISIIFLVVWLAFGIYDFKKLKHDYTLYWPTHTITLSAWRERSAKSIPLYRTSRFGNPIEAFNIEWLGNLAKIQQDLLKQGWQSYEPDFTLTGFLYRLASNSTAYHLPLLPQLYQNRYPVLLMTRNINNNKQSIILRLWRSNINIQDAKDPLWIGIINYRDPTHKFFTIHIRHRTKKYFIGATEALVPFLKDHNWQLIIYPKNKQPEAMQKLHWNGKVLMIRNPSGFALQAMP